ncbi:hypothetical protein GCM10010442_51050 [Kitasatospora kifunensis]
MTVVEYVLLFLLAMISGFGLPGPGDASMIAAGTLAGEGKLNIWIVLGISMTAWLAGSVVGFVVGFRQGRELLERPGWFEKRRRELLAKGDDAFGRRTFTASMVLPAFVSGVFRVRFPLFLLGALTAGAALIGLYVGVSYFLGPEVAERIGSAGTRAVLGIVLVVAIGLGIRAALSKWRAARRRRSQ